jgi:hypothetical protein
MAGQDVHEGKDLCLCPGEPLARFTSGVFAGDEVCWMSASVPPRQAGESDPRRFAAAAPRQRPAAKGTPAWPGSAAGLCSDLSRLRGGQGEKRTCHD